jgi:hypothetical protein
LLSQSEHHGTASPVNSSPASGFTTKNWKEFKNEKLSNLIILFIAIIMGKLTSYPNEKAITEMSTPKKNSSFLKPYLSRNRNVSVSKTVIRTPPHKGILKKKIIIIIQLSLKLTRLRLIKE